MRNKNMAYNKYLVILCTFSCLCRILCQLNLSEDSPCVTHNMINGTCVRLFKCGSAVLTYLYRNAGYVDDKHLPPLPEICSYKNEEPVVCCTDCVLTENDEYKDTAIAPYGVLVSRRGRLAWQKCLDYFQRLPYPCNGQGDVKITKTWTEDKACHNLNLTVTFTIAGQGQQDWKFPHLALLGFGDKADAAQWLCEGTVISERFILTAARCTNAGVFGNVAFAALGLQTRMSHEKHWKIYDIKRIIIHPEYNEPSWYNDIALLETDREILFDSETLPACLDVGIHDVSVAGAAGIQINATNSTQITELQIVYLDQLSGIECLHAYQPNNQLIHGYNYETQTCYAARNRTNDTCKRIGGSPLQVDQFDCQYTVVGVTSYVKECGRPKVADIHTRILHYVPWIEKIVWPEEN